MSPLGVPAYCTRLCTCTVFHRLPRITSAHVSPSNIRPARDVATTASSIWQCLLKSGARTLSRLSVSRSRPHTYLHATRTSRPCPSLRIDSSLVDVYYTPLCHSSMARTELEARPPRHSPGIASHHESNLPPRPSSTCEHCWTGPFAAQLGLFRNGGYSYLVLESEMEQRASSGCAWCKLLLGEISRGRRWRRFKRVKELPERRLSIKVMIEQPQVRFTPTDVQELRVSMDDKTWVLQMYLTTLESGSINHTQRTWA